MIVLLSDIKLEKMEQNISQEDFVSLAGNSLDIAHLQYNQLASSLILLYIYVYIHIWSNICSSAPLTLIGPFKKAFPNFLFKERKR